MREQSLLDLARYLLFRLLRAGAGIACQNETRADGDFGILAARHREQRTHAEEYCEPGENEHHRAIPESGADGVHGLTPPLGSLCWLSTLTSLTRAPSRSRCCPATTT